MRLTELREAKGLTKKGLGELANIPPSTIWQYECRKIRPSKKRVQQLIAVLGCTAAELMGSDFAEWQVAVRKAEARAKRPKPYAAMGNELRRLRKAAGINREKAAYLLGISKSAVTSYEGGRQPISKQRFAEIKAIYSDPDYRPPKEDWFDFRKEDEEYHRQLALANGSWRPR